MGGCKGRAFHFKSGIWGFAVSVPGAERRLLWWLLRERTARGDEVGSACG